MRLTTKGHVAVRAMVDLATGAGDKPVTLLGVSRRQAISLSYLEQLFSNLRRHSIVASVRGPGGGYYLARPASTITVIDIILAVDPPLEASSRQGRSDVRRGHPCSTDALWRGLTEVLHAYLSAVNLQQLVDQNLREMAEATPAKVGKRARKANTSARRSRK